MSQPFTTASAKRVVRSVWPHSCCCEWSGSGLGRSFSIHTGHRRTSRIAIGRSRAEAWKNAAEDLAPAIAIDDGAA